MDRKTLAHWEGLRQRRIVRLTPLARKRPPHFPGHGLVLPLRHTVAPKSSPQLTTKTRRPRRRILRSGCAFRQFSIEQYGVRASPSPRVLRFFVVSSSRSQTAKAMIGDAACRLPSVRENAKVGGVKSLFSFVLAGAAACMGLLDIPANAAELETNVLRRRPDCRGSHRPIARRRGGTRRALFPGRWVPQTSPPVCRPKEVLGPLR